jgi:urea transport system permease protein
MTPTDFINAFFNGLSNSSILILTALGLSITFGVMRVINMAHGDMLMLGAYTGFVLTDREALPILVNSLGQTLGQNWDIDSGLELGIYLALPLVFLIVGFIGYLLEVCLIRFLYGRPLDTLLATWGVGLILKRVVSLMFGPDLKPLELPEELLGNLAVEDMAFPYYRIFILGLTCLAILVVFFWYYRTSFGLQMRAVTQNRPMAASLGISTRRVDALTFAFGTGLAGVAGCIFGYLYNVKANMGNDYLIDAFMVVILGGMGSIVGSIVAGVIIGTGTSILAKYLSTSGPEMLRQVDGPMARVAILVLVVAFIMIKPSGLFPPKERKYD